MKQAIILPELIKELQTVASYSDQRLADRLNVARETVRRTRLKFESNLFAYLGENFINYRISELMRIVQRYKTNYDQLEKRKTTRNEKAIQITDFDIILKCEITYIDIKFTLPSTNEIIRITKEQTKIQKEITKILTSNILKIVIAQNPNDDNKPFPFDT